MLALALFLALGQELAPAPDETSEKVVLQVAEDTEFDLEAFWEPCRESAYGRFEASEVLRNIAPDRDWDFHGAGSFSALLPDRPVAVGETWDLGREAALPFLRQFHAGASGTLHHEPSGVGGAHACLRALSESHAEILLRAHAEFVLEGEIYYCPAQFEGRLLLERATGEVLSFHLFLPSRNSNVDVNIPSERTREMNRKAGQPMIITQPDGSKVQIITGKSYGEADIGWVPRMELIGGEAPEGLEWTASIPDEAARLALRRCFYAPIDWAPLDVAVHRARQESRPLHVVVLFGSYDDESC